MKRMRFMTIVLIAAAASLIAASATAFAVPAAPGSAVFVQPDGSAITVHKEGDEFLGWTEDGEGNLIVFDVGQNAYCYARWTDEGPASTGAPASSLLGKTPLANMMMQRHRTKARNIPQNVLDMAQQAREAATAARLESWPVLTDTQMRLDPAPVRAPISSLKRQLLMIHVTWSNRAGINTPKLNGRQIYDVVFNPNTKSVNNYYREVIGTDEDIILPAEVKSPLDGAQGIIEVTLPGAHTNPGNNTEGTRALVESAITEACTLGLVNMKDYDKNNDGLLAATELTIGFIVDGYESTIASAHGPSIWGFAFLYPFSGSITNGVTIESCFGQGAFHASAGDAAKDIMTIGIICHELGHSAYKFNDTYDVGYLTDINRAEGQGFWSLMGRGNWGSLPSEKLGTRPVYPDAWNLVYGNFVAPGVISDGESAALTSHHDIYKVPTTNPNQYFLLQQRKYGMTENYDQGAFSIMGSTSSSEGGMLIYHIDDEVFLLISHSKPGHNRAGIEEAHGGVQHLQQRGLYHYGDVGDLWGREKTEFSHTSDPGSGLYSAFTEDLVPPDQNTPSGVAITNILWDSAAGTTSFTMGKASPVMLGDVDGNGRVAPMDATLLSRYLAGWPGIVIDRAAADVDGDGEVTPFDLAILQRHIANWPGYETLPYQPSPSGTLPAY
ncbi:MAG: dockerin type I domain-containing protein [Clostridiales bacterium]|nr:dockerin type I domain-containing protein [Clostridiales bacterium]